MREILFRGKRTDNGEWIYGNLVQFPRHGIVRIVRQEPPYEDAEVAPETVGQFTGLTDNKGRKIFEGDIVTFKTFTQKLRAEVIHNGCDFWCKSKCGKELLLIGIIP